jgi:aminoglycoside 6'-N-acetyltransferase I
MAIIPVDNGNARAWAGLCNELWPHHSIDEMLSDFYKGEYQNEYLYYADDMPVAFMSLSIRNEYVEGRDDDKPVGYLEGIYVKPECRRQGIARALVQYAKLWSAERGCAMLASDCELSNADSRAFHNKMGFNEVSINIHFTQAL